MGKELEARLSTLAKRPTFINTPNWQSSSSKVAERKLASSSRYMSKHEQMYEQTWNVSRYEQTAEKKIKSGCGTLESVDVGHVLAYVRSTDCAAYTNICRINRSPVPTKNSNYRGLCGEFCIWYFHIWVARASESVLAYIWEINRSHVLVNSWVAFRAWALCGDFCIWYFDIWTNQEDSQYIF